MLFRLFDTSQFTIYTGNNIDCTVSTNPGNLLLMSTWGLFIPQIVLNGSGSPV